MGVTSRIKAHLGNLRGHDIVRCLNVLHNIITTVVLEIQLVEGWGSFGQLFNKVEFFNQNCLCVLHQGHPLYKHK